MSISANIGLAPCRSVGSFSDSTGRNYWPIRLLARNDPHIKLMLLKEWKFAAGRFAAETTSKDGSYIYKSAVIVTRKYFTIACIQPIMQATV
jgi:hypothetical protein